MKIFTLADQKEPWAAILRDKIVEIRSVPSAYETIVKLGVNETGCIFITTSKEIHLQLGRLGEQARRAFLEVVRGQLPDEDSQMIIRVDEDDNARRGLLVTGVRRNASNEVFVIHLSEAH